MVGYEYEHGSSENDINWGEMLNKALPDTIDFREANCWGAAENGKPLVAWAFHSYLARKNHNIKEYEASVSIASFTPHWHPLKMIRLILALFFKNTGYDRLTAVTHKSNHQAVRLVKLAGFTLEGEIRKPAKIENKLQFSILREDWEAGRFYVR
jgi:hypothetical protein